MMLNDRCSSVPMCSTVCTTAFLSALLALLIFHVFHHFFQLSIRDAFVLTLFYGFGTIAFSYSTTFYCHQPAAFCSFLSFVLVMHVRKGTVRKKRLQVLLAGFCAASAVLFEPSALLLLAAVFTYLVCCKESRKYFPLFLLGCVPPGIVQCAYNSICFGHPLASSYSYANDVVMWKVEGRLFGVPSPLRLLQLLFSPYRGLFVSSPILLMSLIGIVLSLKAKKMACEKSMLCSGAALLFILFIASFYAWHGGSAIGPRYLLPVFPFMFFLTVFAFRSYPKTVTVLGVASLLVNLSVTLVGNEIPRTVGNPLRDVIWRNLLEGRVSINPVPFSNFTAYPNIYELAQVGSWPSNFNSFNLGEMLFPHTIASIVPLVCFWIVWGVWWHKNLPRQ